MHSNVLILSIACIVLCLTDQSTGKKIFSRCLRKNVVEFFIRNILICQKLDKFQDLKINSDSFETRNSSLK